MTAAGAALDRLVRVQPDFPRPGVLFRDLTPVLADGPALRMIAEELAAAAPAAAVATAVRPDLKPGAAPRPGVKPVRPTGKASPKGKSGPASRPSGKRSR